MNSSQGLWYTESGPNSDCVLSSRLRLARNIGDFSFPQKLEEDETQEISRIVDQTVKSLKDEFTRINLNDCNEVDKRVLLENNQISGTQLTDSKSFIFLSGDGNTTISVNHIDHLRFSRIESGFNLMAAYERMDSLDSEVENFLDYAVSLDWGYLTTEMSNVGTGMRGSVLLHLPALAEQKDLEIALKSISRSDCIIKGFFAQQDQTLESFIQVSNSKTIGAKEHEILKKLEDTVLQLVNYEQRAREELLQKKRYYIEDKIQRALGVLRHARLIDLKEGLRLLSLLRLGIGLGFVTDVSFETVTSLLFLTQSNHVKKTVDPEKSDSGESDKYERAELFRKWLNGSAQKDAQHV